MNDPQQLQDLQHLEDLVRAMQWETVSLEPVAEDVQALDQHLPDAWVAERDLEDAFDREVLDPLSMMNEHELNSVLDIPPGDIDTNAQNAVQELGIDLAAMIRDIEGQERSLDASEIAPLDQDIDHDDDFGR